MNSGHVRSLRSSVGGNCTFGRIALLHLGKMLSSDGSQCDQKLLLDAMNARACGWGFESCDVKRSFAELRVTVCHNCECSGCLSVGKLNRSSRLSGQHS